MTRPWTIIDTAQVPDGKMTLLKRDEGDYLIRMNHYILMNSKLNLTELALAKLAIERLPPIPAPNVLISGLGMGYTLRAALDVLPTTAQVTVAELNPIVAQWCQGPIKQLTNAAVHDPRVNLQITDVTKVIAKAAKQKKPFDAIILDMYEGVHEARTNPRHPIYGQRALRTARNALTPKGIFAAWTEEPDPHFKSSLKKAGFAASQFRPGKGGPRHVVYLGVKTDK